MEEEKDEIVKGKCVYVLYVLCVYVYSMGVIIIVCIMCECSICVCVVFFICGGYKCVWVQVYTHV